MVLGKYPDSGVSKGVIGVCSPVESLSKILSSEKVESTLEIEDSEAKDGRLGVFPAISIRSYCKVRWYEIVATGLEISLGDVGQLIDNLGHDFGLSLIVLSEGIVNARKEK